MSVIERLSNYKNIAHYLRWIQKAATKTQFPIHPIISILEDRRSWAETYLSKMDSDLAVLSGAANLDHVASRMENQEQFYDERTALGAAADYQRKGFKVDFILESVTKRPDFQARSPRATSIPCVFEVKHIASKETVDSLFQDIQSITSPYVVDGYVGYLQLASQARHIALEVGAEIEKLTRNSATPTPDKPFQTTILDCEFKIYLKESRKEGPTTIRILWSNREDFKQTASRLSGIMDGAQEQLSSYIPDTVNIILLDVDRAGLHDDEVHDVLYSTQLPGLFTLNAYQYVTAVKFVSHVIPPTITLFENQNNLHVKSGLLKTLGV
jgi:hypothetical protein